MMNIAKPRPFQVELNKIRKENNPPPITTPDNPPSHLILNVMAQQTTMTNMERKKKSSRREETSTVNTREEENETDNMEEVREAGAEASQQSDTSTVMHVNLTVKERREYLIKCEDISLMIYSKQSVEWPKKVEFTTEALVQGLKKKKIQIHVH